jgi:hypothetical protein
MAKEAKADFMGHKIAATKMMSADLKTFEAKLYIDGRVVDSSKAAPRHVGFLKGSITVEDKIYIIEVFAAGKWWKTELIIKIDGQQVASSNN